MSIREVQLAKLGYEEENLEAQNPVKDATMVEVSGSAALPGTDNSLVWLQDMHGNIVYPGFNPRTQVRVGLPVLVARSPKAPYDWQVLEPDWSKIRFLQGYKGSPLYKQHAPDHEWKIFKPGADPVTIYERAMAMLRTQPVTGLGLMVWVSALTYQYANQFVSFPGAFVDLTSFQPAVGLARLVLVGLDWIDRVIVTVAGPTTIDTATVWPDAPAIPANTFVSALVRLDGSQTVFTELDMFDPRMFLSPGIGSVTAASAAWTLPMCGA